jgi:hypothetical protein
MTTATDATRNLATLAQMRLDQYEMPHEVSPYRLLLVDEQRAFCTFCGFGIEAAPDGPWRHAQRELEAMRAIAAEKEWPG